MLLQVVACQMLAANLRERGVRKLALKGVSHFPNPTETSIVLNHHSLTWLSGWLVLLREASFLFEAFLESFEN